MPSAVASALVFFSSAAVLALEILAARLLAPYVGVTLETYSGIIATVLAGISVGAWLGGRAADRWDPRRLLGFAIAAGGVLTLLTVPAVRWAGQSISGSRIVVTVGLAFLFFAPAMVLSTVPPMVVKLRLHDLTRTGRVAGQLSAVSTAGAIFGTLVTGFVFIAALPIRGMLVTLGVALVAVGLGLWVWLGRGRGVSVAAICFCTILGVSAVAVTGTECHRDTKYYCARVARVAASPSQRVLFLDNLQHSYIDLADPLHLVGYMRTAGDVIDASHPGGSSITVLHVGGGGFTMPRYIAEKYPGSRQHVVEVDPGVVRLAKDRLGLRPGAHLTVETADGRLAVRNAEQRTFDLVFGDAFGGIAVPWHLTTREFVTDVKRVLTPGGQYVINLVDYPPLDFVRAELATMRDVFRNVVVVAQPEKMRGLSGGNFIAVASDERIDEPAIDGLVDARNGDEEVFSARAVSAFAGGTDVLTDDFAPVDQLVTPPWRRPYVQGVGVVVSVTHALRFHE